MADVILGPNVDGFTIYDVEPTAWATPRVFTFDRRRDMAVADDKRIDILILGDGFLAEDRDAFEDYVSDWYDRFAALWPYSMFISAFRVRAAFVESSDRVSNAGNSYFGVKISDSNLKAIEGIEGDSTFLQKLYDAVEAILDTVSINMQTYPEELKLGWSGDDPSDLSEIRSARGRSVYSRLASNLTIVMALNRDQDSTGDEGSLDVGGFAAPVDAPSGHGLEGTKIRVAFGQEDLHEFTHAFSLLCDEYIENDRRGLFQSELHQNASLPSVFELTNLTFTAVGDQAPWRHLAWNDLSPRSGNSRVGQMWIGGDGGERGVWHSEYMCLMNGRHHNYYHRTDEERPYADLRASDRFCLWCEEVLVVRILEKTGALARARDPANINELGRVWYWRWVDELRANYWREFDLNTRIADREAWYNNRANLEVAGVWDGNLAGTNLMHEISTRPHRSASSTLLLFS